jgi:hypothetical protein
VRQLDFHFAGHAIRVTGHQGPLLWLEEFLRPQFRVGDTPAPDRTVRLLLDEREHARLAAHGPHPQRTAIECFTLDTGYVTAAVWNVNENGLVAFDEAADVFYRRPASEPGVVEAVAARDTGRLRVALMRIVREFATMFAVRAGWIILHAGAVRLGNDAFVIAGPKGAGKTTLLLYALRHERGAYISNDRLALHVDETGAVVRGIPTIVSLRKGSVALFPGLDAALGARQYDHRLRLEECRAADATPILGGPTNWLLTPLQLCDLLAVESSATGRVSALLFPQVMDEPGVPTLEELSPDRATAALTGATFRSCPSDGMFRIDEGPGNARGEYAAAATARLLSRVPSFVCRLGLGPHDSSPGWLTRLARTRAREPRL